VTGLGLGLALALSSCGSDGPALTTPHPQNPVLEGAARVHQGDTVTIGSMFACLNQPGSVTITDIAPVHPNGLEVTGWAVRPNPFWKPAPANPAHVTGQIGVARAPLSELAFPSSRVVDATCGKNGEGFEFAVQVKKTTNGEAGASGWVATYKSDGKTKKFGFLLSVQLCNEKSSDSKKCNALKV
jgi:hypothetical protein